jgi:hypothetical protein
LVILAACSSPLCHSSPWRPPSGSPALNCRAISLCRLKIFAVHQLLLRRMLVSTLALAAINGLTGTLPSSALGSRLVFIPCALRKRSACLNCHVWHSRLTRPRLQIRLSVMPVSHVAEGRAVTSCSASCNGLQLSAIVCCSVVDSTTPRRSPAGRSPDKACQKPDAVVFSILRDITCVCGVELDDSRGASSWDSALQLYQRSRMPALVGSPVSS